MYQIDYNCVRPPNAHVRLTPGEFGEAWANRHQTNSRADRPIGGVRSIDFTHFRLQEEITSLMRNMESNSSFRVSWLRDELAQRNEQRLVCAAEEGFTLIELMVVLLILAILLAIAIPTFLGVKGGAQDRAAQSNLTNALIVGKTISSQAGGVYPTTVTSLVASFASSEPGLTFSTTSVAVT